MPYWESDPTENIFMEVTKRGGIGDNILAPIARGGMSAACNLALTMQKGDIVIHYSSKDRQIALVSRVSGDPKWTEFEWTADNAGAKAGWNEGVFVPLRRRHAKVEPPLTLDEIKGKQSTIFAMKRKLERDFGKDGLHFPWIDYNGTLRTALPYVSKFPRAALDLFPRLRQAVEELP